MLVVSEFACKALDCLLWHEQGTTEVLCNGYSLHNSCSCLLCEVALFPHFSFCMDGPGTIGILLPVSSVAVWPSFLLGPSTIHLAIRLSL